MFKNFGHLCDILYYQEALAAYLILQKLKPNCKIKSTKDSVAVFELSEESSGKVCIFYFYNL